MGNENNDDLSIVIGLIVFLMVLMIYNRPMAKRPCCKQMRYTDAQYYELPILNTATEPTESLNDMTTQPILRKYRPLNKDIDTTRQRWAGNETSQSMTDVYGRRVNQYGDLQSTPNERLGGQIKSNAGVNLPTHTEPFADNEWLDVDFSPDNKYRYKRNPKLGGMVDIIDVPPSI